MQSLLDFGINPNTKDELNYIFIQTTFIYSDDYSKKVKHY